MYSLSLSKASLGLSAEVSFIIVFTVNDSTITFVYSQLNLSVYFCSACFPDIFVFET